MRCVSYLTAFLTLCMTALLGNAQEWQRTICVNPNNVAGELAAAKLDSKQPVNWFTGRWPYISFIGGMVMGNRSEDLEFFYSEPFQWHSTVLDYVLTGGGKVYGLRAKFHPYKEDTSRKSLRSYLLTVRTDVLLAEYHPSYILANGRRVWDFKKHKMGAASIQVPFSMEGPSGVTIDLVVDRDHTPGAKGLAFRMFFLNYLGDAGVKVDLRAPSRKLPAPRPTSCRISSSACTPAATTSGATGASPLSISARTGNRTFGPAIPPTTWACARSSRPRLPRGSTTSS